MADLSLEELRDLRVLTVSRFEEGLDTAAASAYVLTAEDIRRAGVRTLPEALRLVPTLDVARADANQYAISARGFNNVLANKMLVLIDGRPVYTPLFSGVFWEAQDVMLEDVERIEVVTGPATALWGSNAVNGLIHVITKAAVATRGGIVAASAGNRQRDLAARWGGGGDGEAMRLYAKTFERDDTRRADGSSVFDASRGRQAGFRADWVRTSRRATLQGDLYGVDIDQPGGPGRRAEGANLIARWEELDGGGNGLTVQALLDVARRAQPGLLDETLRTADLVAQFAFEPRPGHRLLVGGGTRHADDRVRLLGPAIAFVPASRHLAWHRLFVQDHATLAPDWQATLTVSAEDNPYTGLEWLPSARLAWRPAGGALWWAAVSRAVRSPSRIDREFFLPAQPPYQLAGGADFQSELSNVFELGVRGEAGSALAYSLTLFRQDHRSLRSQAPAGTALQLANGIEGHTQGAEAWLRWRATPVWRIDAGGVVQSRRLGVRPGEVDIGGLASLGNDPRHWVSLRSTLELGPTLQWQTGLRNVGSRPAPQVPSYTALDTRLAWQVNRSSELALMVANVLDPGHAEWGVPSNRVEFERSVALQWWLRY